MREIKQLTEVKAKDVSIDLKTKLDDVMKDLKKKVEKSKPKPTVPKIGSNLYPDNPKEDHQRKI